MVPRDLTTSCWSRDVVGLSTRGSCHGIYTTSYASYGVQQLSYVSS